MEETKPMAAPVPPSGKPLSKRLIAIIAIAVVAIVVIASVSYVVMRQGGGGGIFGEKDSDGDGHPDSEDAFPNDASEWKDSDNDGHGDNGDAFPNNPSEWKDSDNDGHGDNGDAFPNNPSEWKDSDSDGVGDNADAFPNDSSETKDSDNDGVGDNSDAFPTNPNEQYDSDNDGVGNNADKFPYDSTQWADRDGDGYGDNPNGNNPDAFPDDSTEWKDSDSDGIGDNADIYDAGNGGIKIAITYFEMESDYNDEWYYVDSHYWIYVDINNDWSWDYTNETEDGAFADQTTVYNPFYIVVDVADDITRVNFRIIVKDEYYFLGALTGYNTIDYNSSASYTYNDHAVFSPFSKSWDDTGEYDGVENEGDCRLKYSISVVKA